MFSNFRIHIILDGSLQSPLFMNSNIFSTMMPFTAVLMLLCAATLSSGASRPLSNVSHGTILNVEESYRRLRAFHAIAGYRPASSVSDYVRANRGCSTFTLLYPYSQTYFLTISLLRATILSPLERDWFRSSSNWKRTWKGDRLCLRKCEGCLWEWRPFKVIRRLVTWWKPTCCDLPRRIVYRE